MDLYTLFINFFFSSLATIGFSIFFNSPIKVLTSIRNYRWYRLDFYKILFDIFGNAILSNFLAATLISLLSEILARKMKYPAIIFVIPGILPLIPGLGLYNTMLYLVKGNYTNAVSSWY